MSPLSQPRLFCSLAFGRHFLSCFSFSFGRSLTSAIRYGASRLQFGPPNGAEIPILNYTTHKMRLYPALAKCFAYNFSANYLRVRRAFFRPLLSCPCFLLLVPPFSSP